MQGYTIHLLATHQAQWEACGHCVFKFANLLRRTQKEEMSGGLGFSLGVLCPLPETETRTQVRSNGVDGLVWRDRSLYTVGIITEDQSAKSKAMYEAYGKLIIGNEQRNGSTSTTDGMHNQKLESGENLYGDIQKEKENRDEMEMSDGDGIGGRGSGMRNMTQLHETQPKDINQLPKSLLNKR
ncbi:hypothetical protein EDB19DRAFT_1830869 [Suillus lakei]|nr:hypothetical protein EDB19DRAFT_1830869 [Suillus lakei]